MSLIPALISELLDEYRRPNYVDLYDQNFCLGLLENEALRPTRFLTTPLRCGYLRPWRNVDAGNSGLSTVHTDKDEFKINLDVQQFKPEELKVKVEGNLVVVEGKHEEREDQHGFVSRQFTRKYKVPDDVDVNALKSNLSSDGVLTLKAPKKISPDATSREIPITHTNAPVVKETKEEKTE